MKNGTLLQVLIAIVLAFIAGWITGPDSELLGVPYIKIYGLIGQLFLNALTFVVIPLVSSCIITEMAKMGSEQSFGRLGAKTFGYFVLTSFLATLVGVFVFLLFSPGTFTDGLHAAKASIDLSSSQVSVGTFDRISQILFRIIPSNILAIASQDQMLGLILFSLLFGFLIAKVDTQPAHTVALFFRGIFQIMMRLTHLVMKFLPIGVFGLIAKVVATTGLESIRSVFLFFVTVLSGISIYMFVVLPLLLLLIARVNPLLHFRAMAPALFTAFSTSSTIATLPVTIECVEKRAGVSNRICSFAIPLGSALNMSGGALYKCITSLFLAHVFGIELSIFTISLTVLLSLLTSFGMAGIPSASLISIVVILQSIGVPPEAIGLIMPVERILDMFRTVVNVFGNTCCAVLIARSEGEKDVLAPHSLVHNRENPEKVNP